MSVKLRSWFKYIALLIICLLTVSCSSNQKNTSVTQAPAQEQRSAQPSGTSDIEQAKTAHSPQQPQAVNSAATQSSEAKQTPAAQVSSEKVKEAEALYDNGFESYLNGSYDEAIRLFDRAAVLDPSCYKAYNGKGIVLCFKGNYKDGMELIKKALGIKPDFVYANFNMAMSYKLQRDYDNALVWFNKALNLDPKDTWSYYGISTIYADRNNTSKAIEYLKKAVDLDPSVKDAAKSQSHYDNMRSNPDFTNIVK